MARQQNEQEYVSVVNYTHAYPPWLIEFLGALDPSGVERVHRERLGQRVDEPLRVNRPWYDVRCINLGSTRMRSKDRSDNDAAQTLAPIKRSLPLSV